MAAPIFRPETKEKSNVQKKKLVKIKIGKRSCRFLAQIVADGRPKKLVWLVKNFLNDGSNMAVNNSIW